MLLFITTAFMDDGSNFILLLALWLESPLIKGAALDRELALGVCTTNRKMAIFAKGLADVVTWTTRISCHVASFLTLMVFTVEFPWRTGLFFLLHAPCLFASRTREWGPLYHDTDLQYLKAWRRLSCRRGRTLLSDSSSAIRVSTWSLVMLSFSSPYSQCAAKVLSLETR